MHESYTLREYRGFALQSRLVPDRLGTTRTGHTEWTGRQASGFYRRHRLRAGTLAALKRLIDRKLA